MSEHDWLMLLIGANLGAAAFLVVLLVVAAVSGYAHGYHKAVRGDE